MAYARTCLNKDGTEGNLNREDLVRMNKPQPFLKQVSLAHDEVESFDRYPYSIPAVRYLNDLKLHPKVTFFVGENGTGKSTLLEAIAIAEGFNPEGGSRNFSFATRDSHSELFANLKFERGIRRLRHSDGYFFRAESYFNVATEIERLDEIESDEPEVIKSYGERSLHEQSHGESFWSLVSNRFGGDGLYLFDEPEAALSPSRQLSLLAAIHDLVGNDSTVHHCYAFTDHYGVPSCLDLRVFKFQNRTCQLRRH